MFRSLFFLIVIFIIASCGPSAPQLEILEKAESIARDQPDSARLLIASLTPATLRHPDAAARATIVDAEVAYQKSERVLSDSLLDVALEYYRLRLRDPRRIRAYFLRAYQYQLADSIGPALVDYMHAAETAAELSDTLSLGLIYRGMGDIYSSIYSFPDALDAYRLSYLYFRHFPGIKYMTGAMHDLARSYYNSEMNDSALVVLDSLDLLTKATDDIIFARASLRTRAKVMIQMSRFREGEKLFSQINSMVGDEGMTRQNWEDWGLCHIKMRNFEAAEYCNSHILAIDSTDTWLSLAIATATGDIENAYKYMFAQLDSVNAFSVKQTQQPAHSKLRAYYSDSSAKNRAQLRSIRLRTYIYIALFSLAFAFAVFFFVRRIKSHKACIVDTRRQIVDMSLRLDALKKDLEKSRQLDPEQFIAQFGFIDKIYSPFYELKGRANEALLTANRLSAQIRSLRYGGDFFRQLEKMVDNNMDGLMRNLRKDIPSMSPADLELYLYKLLRFSSESICLILDVSREKLYSRNYNLKQKLERPDNPDNGLYSGMIYKKKTKPKAAKA